MKHTINLLPHALKPQLELLTIYTVMIAMMLSFMSMFGMSSYMDHDKRLARCLLQKSIKSAPILNLIW